MSIQETAKRHDHDHLDPGENPNGSYSTGPAMARAERLAERLHLRLVEDVEPPVDSLEQTPTDQT